MAFENFSVRRTDEDRPVMVRLSPARGTRDTLASFAVADGDEVSEYAANDYVDASAMTREQLLEAVRLLVVARTRR